MLQVPVVFLANVLQNFLIRIPGRLRHNGPWFRVVFRIVDGGFEAKGVRIGPRKPFGHVQLFAMLVPGGIQPGAVVKAQGVDHERIAFPLPNRISEVRRIGVLRLLAAIQPDIAPDVSAAATGLI